MPRPARRKGRLESRRAGALRVEPPRGSLSGRRGGLMRKTEECVSWVVYRMTIHGRPGKVSAVCGQQEWEALEVARPGYHTLALAGTPNGGEAERLARAASAAANPSKRPERKALTRL